MAPRRPETVEAVTRLVRAGKTDRAIAAELGFTNTYVAQVRRDAGLAVNPLRVKVSAEVRRKRRLKANARYKKAKRVSFGTQNAWSLRARAWTGFKISDASGLTPATIAQLVGSGLVGRDERSVK